MFGFIKRIFGAIFAFIRGLFGGGKQQQIAAQEAEAKASNGTQLSPEQEILAAVRAAQNDTPKVQTQRQAEIKQNYAAPEPAKAIQDEQPQNNSKPEPSEAQPVQATAQPQAAQSPPVAVAQPPQTPTATEPQDNATALNMPEPKVTTFSNFSNFGERRRPGANMDSFLKMARQVRTSS